MKQPQRSENYPVAVRDVLLLPRSRRPVKAALEPVDGCGSQLPLRLVVVQEVAVLEEPELVKREEVEVGREGELEVVKVEVVEEEEGQLEVVKAAAAAHFKSLSSLWQLRPLSSWSSPPIP